MKRNIISSKNVLSCNTSFSLKPVMETRCCLFFLWPDNHKHVVVFRNITLISKYIITWRSSPCLLLIVFMWHQAYQIKVHICLCLADANNILFFRNGCCQATFLCRHFSAYNIFSLLLDNFLFRKIPDV